MNQTIYFRKDVWTRFGLEKKKSELVNHLLELHYENDVVEPGSFKAYDNGDVSYIVNPIKKPSEVLEKLKPEGKLCKHGTSMEFCKFAKFINGKKVCK